MKHGKKLSRKALALILALAVVMSMLCVGIAMSTSAATVGSTFYVDISQNSNRKNKTILCLCVEQQQR